MNKEFSLKGADPAMLTPKQRKYIRRFKKQEAQSKCDANNYKEKICADHVRTMNDVRKQLKREAKRTRKNEKGRVKLLKLSSGRKRKPLYGAPEESMLGQE